MKLLLIFLLFSTSLYANMPIDDEAVVKQTIDQWYGQIGLSGKVSKEEFEAAVRGYFHYKSRVKKNIIGIVNYKIPTTERRFFIFQIGPNAKMLREEWVAHGTNSGPAFGVTESFSNTNGSHQSSRGFYVTGETYHGNWGYSLRLDGLEQSVNHKMRPMPVVVHGGRYVGPGQGGRSWGCLTLAMSRKDQVIDLIKGGVLIYGSDGQSHNSYTFMGGAGSINAGDISNVPGTDNDPGAEFSEKYAAFEDIDVFKNVGQPTGDVEFGGNDYGAIGTQAAIPVMEAMSGVNDETDEGKDNSMNEDATNPLAKDTSAPLHGTPGFANCQKRASDSWCKVVGAASVSPEAAYGYFAGTYTRMNEVGKNMDQTPDDVLKNMAVQNHAENEQCVALAATTEETCNGQEANPNEPKTITSNNGRVTCTYETAEGLDFQKCKEMIDATNASDVAKVNMKDEQSRDFQDEGAKRLEAVKNSGNIQVAAGVAQVNTTKSQANIVAQRSDFQIAKLQTLNNLQAAMPNRNSLLTRCRTKMKGERPGLKYLKAYVNHLEVKDKSIPSTPDPCLSVIKTMNTNMVQNIPARKQAIKLIEEAGLKALDLNDKERSLLGQSQKAKNSGLQKTNFNSMSYAPLGEWRGKNENQDASLDGKLDYSSLGCQGQNCKYRGGQGMKLNARGNGDRSGSGNFNFNRLGNFRAGPGGSKGSDSKVLTFEQDKNKLGVFDENFYANVDLALAGKIPLSALSPAQRKEFNALREFRLASSNVRQKNRRPEASKKKPASKSDRKGLGKEIWFDTTMDLFKIISNRYQEAVKDDRL